ncbi:uncharacterized protein LOC124159194 isoform X1 [Ischnura elegans]|uniref:uncharacterized protein LOC124159194 isoform X1 n=1 Tax=Ischnura elegans TaxID=197161 RepID=UPI001ED87EC1|nr:uncharacterized protein LOC124159194 isoform X1 [Ischnura elegans]
MDVEEVQSLPLSVPLYSSFAVTWSEDDCVSVLTPKGTYVLVLRPTAYDFLPIFDYKRYWIASQQKIPTEKLGIDPNKIINKLEKDDFYNLAADINLSPNLEATDPITPSVSQVAWSSRGMVNFGRCMMAVLTNTGLVTFHYLRNSKWNMCSDFSKTLRAHFEKCWEQDSKDVRLLNASKQLNFLKKRVIQMKTTVVGWSHMFFEANSSVSYFITGQANGEIMIWKIPALSGEQSKIEPIFVNCFESKLMRMTSLLWLSIEGSKGFLIAGDISGIIKLFRLRLNPDNPNDVELVGDMDIWPEYDNIPVKNIKLLSGGANLSDVQIVAIKGNFVVVVSLGDDGVPAHRASLLVGKFCISGCEILGNASVILASQSGSMTKVNITKAGDGGINLDAIELKSNIDLSDKLCHGFGASRNKMIGIMLNSIYKPFDHLVLRDPTTAVLFTMEFMPNPLTLLLKNPSFSLTNHWDCVETLRVQVARGRYSTTVVNTENLLSQSPYQLSCSLWIYQIITKYRSQGNELSDETSKTVRRLEDAIFAHHAIKILQNLPTSDIKSFSDSQLLSFGLFYKWMKIYLSQSDEDMQHIRSLLHTISDLEDFSLLPMEEKCDLCGGNVEMKHWKNAQCDTNISRADAGCQGTGHCIPRCSMSLIQCSSFPYRICRVCHALANKNLVHTDEPICIFCHGLLQLDDRL